MVKQVISRRPADSNSWVVLLRAAQYAIAYFESAFRSESAGFCDSGRPRTLFATLRASESAHEFPKPTPHLPSSHLWLFAGRAFFWELTIVAAAPPAANPAISRS